MFPYCSPISRIEGREIAIASLLLYPCTIQTPSRTFLHNLLGITIDTPAAPLDTEPWIVIGTFDARPGLEAELAGALARYVVLTRGAPGCRNVDLAADPGGDGRFVIVEKWTDPRSPRSHLDGPVAVSMAGAVRDLLRGPPTVELFMGVSAHDLR